MKNLKIIGILLLLGLSTSLMLYRIEFHRKCQQFQVDDCIMINPTHSVGYVTSINKSPNVEVVIVNNIGLSKKLMVDPHNLHKVLFINNLD